MVYFTRIGDLTWRGSYCIELVGTVTGDDEVGAAEASLNELYITTFLLFFKYWWANCLEGGESSLSF